MERIEFHRANWARTTACRSRRVAARVEGVAAASRSQTAFAFTQTGAGSAMAMHSGQCLCGQVKVTVRGDPLRVGICHCTDCRKESGSAFTFYGIWPARQFERQGDTSDYRGRQFCPHCGSRLFSLDDREAEIRLGILSVAPTPLVPSYELWVKRREPWLRPIDGARQYEEDRE
jgi:hypothetical protein